MFLINEIVKSDISFIFLTFKNIYNSSNDNNKFILKSLNLLLKKEER